ncbi:MAG: hypothetical protein EPO18_18860 [Methylobacter sp.]|nr:MAG: hypothetical protein EPO18_18860 [Methylobacter sp.]
MQILQEQISVHAVEKKVTKEKAAWLPLESLGTSLCLALRVRCMQIGYPADLSCARRGIRGKKHPCVTSDINFNNT